MKTSPAYHLRINKNVERLLFIELLRKLDSGLSRHIERYAYVGMGGPYMEDFALIHGAFGIKRMVSLEIKKNVFSRQIINRPCSCVRLTLDSTENYIDNFSNNSIPQIVWFDHEKSDWLRQMSEACDLLGKLPPMSIFKITLPGNANKLGGGSSMDPQAAQAERLSETFRDFGPFTANQLCRKEICSTLYYILRRAIADAVPDTIKRSVRTLASFEYDDGTPILTVSLIIGPLSRIDETIDRSKIRKWPFADLDWSGVKKIDVPSLSIREKILIDQLLPDASAKRIASVLGLRLGETYKESIKALNNYIRIYRQAPLFIRSAL